MFSIRVLALGGVFVAIASVTGCYAESQPAPVRSTTTTSANVATATTGDYEPAYFDGYVVFYTDEGAPYYYGQGGSVVWVPPSSTYYAGLTNHYRVNSPSSYGRWYASTGYRYHAYRGPAGHYYYQGYVRF